MRQRVRTPEMWVEHKRAVKNNENNNALVVHVRRPSHNFPIGLSKLTREDSDKKDDQGGYSHQERTKNVKS